jgi:hypothetical protein
MTLTTLVEDDVRLLIVVHEGREALLRTPMTLTVSFEDPL